MLVKAVLSQSPWLHDPLALEVPWRDDVVLETKALIESAVAGAGSSLAFGVMKWDGVGPLHPPIARGIDIVVKTLQRLGHRVVEWKPPSHATAIELCVCASISWSLSVLVL
jgi:amidase